MYKTLRKSGVKAEFIYYDEKGDERQKRKCAPGYETAIVLIPEKRELVRILYSGISDIREEDFTLAITTE